MAKVCLEWATVNRFRWLPCQDHKPALDPATCQHETVSAVIHANALAFCAASICHSCGDYTDNCGPVTT